MKPFPHDIARPAQMAISQMRDSQRIDTSPRSSAINDLVNRIAEIESGGAHSLTDRKQLVSTGWTVTSHSTSLSLIRGVIHEWLGSPTGCAAAAKGASSDLNNRSRREPIGERTWSPPLLILIHLVRCAVRADVEAGRPSRVLWIGRSIWPHHAALRNLHSAISDQRTSMHGNTWASQSLLHHSLFIDPPTDEMRWWAIDQALRCPAVSAVIADGRGMDMACSRRMQVAAESGGALGLLARAPWEVRELSACMTRWSVSPRPSPMRLLPLWEVECLRCKGVQRRVGTDATSLRFLLEWNRATGCVGVSPALADRSASPHIAPQQRIA